MVARRLPVLSAMPRVRADCARVPRPCPHAACRHRLGDGQCVLDHAERDGMSLQEVGDVLHLSRERVRQIERVALAKVRAVMKDDE